MQPQPHQLLLQQHNNLLNQQVKAKRQGTHNILPTSGPDPGFPIGGHGPIFREGWPPSGHFSVKMYAKMKELGPVGGHVLACPLDLPMSMVPNLKPPPSPK